MGSDPEVAADLPAVPPSSTVFDDILRYFEVFQNIGILRYFAVFRGISRYFAVFRGILRYFTVFCGILRYFVVFSGIQRYFVVFSGIQRYSAVFSGIQRYSSKIGYSRYADRPAVFWVFSVLNNKTGIANCRLVSERPKSEMHL